MKRNPFSLARTFTLALFALALALPGARRLEAAKGPCDGMNATPAILNFPSFGGTQTVQIWAYAECNWGVTGAQPWIGYSPAQGWANGSVTITVQPNFDPFQRATTLWVVGLNGGAATPIQVYQG